MFSKKDIGYLIIALIFITFIIFITKPIKDLISITISFGLAAIIIFPREIIKKLVALKLGCKTEIDLWGFKRYGLRPEEKLKMEVPLWFIVPILILLLSKGILKFFAILVFEAEETSKRAKLKYLELTEYHIALIASSGVLTSLIIGFISWTFGFIEFASWNLWLAFFSLLPLGKLDGTKIFFGSKILFVFLTVLSIIMLFLLNITSSILALIIALFLAVIAVIIFFNLHERK